MLKTTLLAAALFAASALNCQAATTLSGLELLSTDATGRAATTGGGTIWTTQPGGGPAKIWVIAGGPDDPFINGPANTAAHIDRFLTNGTHRFTIYAAPGNESSHYGLNLFFNGIGATPGISVFAPPHRSSSVPVPEFAAHGSQTLNLAGVLVPGAKTLQFVDGQTTITLTSYFFALPTVHGLDRVGPQVATKDGRLDFLGAFTLEVAGAARLPRISSNGVVHAASFGQKVAPGSLITIFGSDLTSGTASPIGTPLPTTLLNTQVTVAGRAIPLTYVSPGQINAQLPYETPLGPQRVIVVSETVASPPAQVTVVPTAPGIFQFGENRAVVQNQDASVNTAANPAKTGSYIVAYLTGGGELDFAVPTGSPAGSDPLSRTRFPAFATINGVPANVLFAGMTPTFIGLMQVNIEVPPLPPGTYPLVISINGVDSNGPMITVN